MTLSSHVVRVAVLALLAAPLVAGAQPANKPARVGILYFATPVFRPDTDPYPGGAREQFRTCVFQLGTSGPGVVHVTWDGICSKYERL